MKQQRLIKKGVKSDKYKSIKDWQESIFKSANKKFSNNTFRTEFDWIRSINEQLKDVKKAIEVEKGIRKSKDHAHQDPDHRIAALIADIFILAKIRKTRL
ncbi:MAG: hypothetical protein AAB873_03155 [Patescibacteria group bacterium]